MRQIKEHLPTSRRESAFSQHSTRPCHHQSCTSISSPRVLHAPLPLGTAALGAGGRTWGLWGLAPARPTTGVLPEAARAPCPVPHRGPGAAGAAARLSWCHVPGAGRAGAPVPHGDAAGSGAAPGAGVARTGPCLSPVPPAAAPVPRRSRRWRGGDLAGPHVPTGQRLPRARSRPLPPVISLPLDVPFFLPLPPKPAGKLEGQSAPLWLLG